MSGKNTQTVHRPDVEAVLRVEGKEIAVIAFFKDAYGGYDVLVGLEDFNQRLLVCSAFNNCAEACKDAEVINLSSNEADPLRS